MRYASDGCDRRHLTTFFYISSENTSTLQFPSDGQNAAGADTRAALNKVVCTAFMRCQDGYVMSAHNVPGGCRSSGGYRGRHLQLHHPTSHLRFLDMF